MKPSERVISLRRASPLLWKPRDQRRAGGDPVEVRAVVLVLHGGLVRQQLLGEEHQADARPGAMARPMQQAQHRREERAPAALGDAPVPVGQEPARADVDDHEAGRRRAPARREDQADLADRPLLQGRAGLGARVDVQDLDAVVAGTQAVEVVAAHRRELLGGVVVVRTAVELVRDVRAAGRAGAGVARAHALLPIQKIPNSMAPMPTTQMTRPSLDRADAADAGTARVGLRLDGLDVVDDRALLRRG